MISRGELSQKFEPYKEVEMERVREILGDVGKTLQTLRKEYSQQMGTWKCFTDQARAEGALSKKVKELVVMALAIARGCDACVAYHTNAALELGATREEMLEICLLSLYMCGGPAIPPTGLVLEAIEKFQRQKA